VLDAKPAHQRENWLRSTFSPAGASNVRTKRAIAAQIALVLGALFAYMAVRLITKGQQREAIAHARSLLHVERLFGIDWEQGAQKAIVHRPNWRYFFNSVYVWAYWPMVILTLMLFWRRDRHRYQLFRDALFISGGIGLIVFALYPVAPPRMLDGFTDTVAQVSRQHFVAHPTGLANEYAALPSFHAGWFVLAASMIAYGAQRFASRVVMVLLAALMSLAVVITANHYVVDVVVGVALSLVGLLVAWRLHGGRNAGQPVEPAADDVESLYFDVGD
jgi:membrane-associated phospholipid phosphatase